MVVVVVVVVGVVSVVVVVVVFVNFEANITVDELVVKFDNWCESGGSGI